VSSAEAIAAQQAIVRRDATFSFIKDSANQDKAVANILEKSADTLNAFSHRGSRVNFTV
jgi:hypothetical protein